MADIKITSGTPAAIPGTPAQAASAAPAVALKPAAAPTAAPPPSAAVAPVPAAKPASSFKDLFSKVAVKAAGPKMIESLVSSKTTVGSKLKPILGSAPQLQKSLEQEKEYRQKKLLRASQIIFAACLLISLGTALYFYSELSPSFSLFGPNTTARLTEVNTNLSSLQTTINKYRYLAAQLDLNSFSYMAEQYLDKTAKLADPSYSDAYKNTLSSEISELENSIPAILGDLRKNLLAEITIKTVRPEGEAEMDEDAIKIKFEGDLRSVLQADRDKLAAGSGEEASNQQDLKLYDNAIKLVGNNALISTVKALSLDALKKDLEDYKAGQNPLLRDKLQKTFSSILSSTNSDVATIAAIKAARIDWAELIRQIEIVTLSVDLNFGKGVYQELGGIMYTGYQFDQESGKIAISGEAKTLDSSTFSLISTLMNKLEESQYFKNVDMRSFAKSGEIENGYTESFTLNLELENSKNVAANKIVSLGKDLLKVRTGFRRIKR